MSEYLITMNDGSQYLAHHGVEGMHWGKWNDETKRKYGVLGSAKGDNLRDKAADTRIKVARLKSDRSVHDAAIKVNSDKITSAYAKANNHHIKKQAYQMRANRTSQKAGKAAAAGNDKKAKRLERKTEKLEGKAKRQEADAKRETDTARKFSNRQERQVAASNKISEKVSKLEAKASKLEKKAAKADAKQDRKVEKAAKDVQERAESYRKETDPREKSISKGDLYKTASKYVSKAEGHGIARQLVDYYSSNSDSKKGAVRRAAIESVMKASLKEQSAISKHGQDAVDAQIEKALGAKRGYRYLA